MELIGAQLPRVVTGLNLRDNFFDNLKIVWFFEGVWKEENFKTDFIESIRQLLALIGRVNIDKNEVSHGSCHLDDDPFPFVIRIDPNSIFGFEAEIFD